MKFKEIQSLSKDDLLDKERDLRKELMKLNAQVATGSNPESPGKIGSIKKTLAKIQTRKKNLEEVSNKA